MKYYILLTALTLLFSSCEENPRVTERAEEARQVRMQEHAKAYQEKLNAEMDAKYAALLIQKQAEDKERQLSSERAESHARGLASLQADVHRAEEAERLQEALNANADHFREQARRDLKESMDRASENLRYQQELEFQRRAQLTEMEFQREMQERAIQADKDSEERAMRFYGR